MAVLSQLAPHPAAAARVPALASGPVWIPASDHYFQIEPQPVGVPVTDGHIASQAPPRTYLVQSGDSLSSIAEAHGWGGNWAGLWHLNAHRIADPSLIRPGMIILLAASPRPPP